MTKRDRGRPRGSVAEKKRDVLIQIKAYEEEQDAYKEAAQRSGLSMSAWIRVQLNKAVKEGGTE